MINATEKFQAQQYLAAGGLLSNFMPQQQRDTLRHQLDGEEGEYFVALVLRIARIIRDAPKTHETDFIPSRQKVVHLHYFRGSIDAWIVERDVGDTEDGDGFGEQLQAFGKITLYGGGIDEAEWGYIPISELIANEVELDLYWEPKTIEECES